MCDLFIYFFDLLQNYFYTAPLHLSASSCTKVSLLMRTQLQVLSGELPFRVVLKVFEVNVNVIVVIWSHHLNHLKLRLILRSLFGDTKRVYFVLSCVRVVCLCLASPNVPSFLQSTRARWRRRLEPEAKTHCKFSEFWRRRRHWKGLKRQDEKALSIQNDFIWEFCATVSLLATSRGQGQRRGGHWELHFAPGANWVCQAEL